MAEDAERLREQILALVRSYHAAAFPERPFQADRRRCHAGRALTPRTLLLVDSSLDFWLTTGRFAAEFDAGLPSSLNRHFS